MANSYQRISALASIIVMLGLGGCFHEGIFAWQSSEVSDESVGDSAHNHDASMTHAMHEEMYPDPVLVDEKILNSLYNGELLDHSLQSVNSCTDLKQNLVANWLGKDMDGHSLVMVEPNYLPPPIPFMYSPYRLPGFNDLIVDNQTLFFMYENTLHVVSVSDDGAMNRVNKLPLDFLSSGLTLQSANTLIVAGHRLESGSIISGQVFAIIDIGEGSAPTERHRIVVAEGNVNLTNVDANSMSMSYRSEIRLPRSLLEDQQFREITENYRDAARLNELYQYAIDNTEGDPASELVEFQAGTQALLDAYEIMFNNKFDEHVESISELLPSFTLVKGQESTSIRPLSCDNLLTSEDDDGFSISGFLDLENVNGGLLRSVALLGQYEFVSLSNDYLLLLSQRHPGYMNESSYPSTLLVQLKVEDDKYELVSAKSIAGQILMENIKLKDGLAYLFSQQHSFNFNSAYPDVGMSNFFVLSIDENGLNKVSELPHVISQMWNVPHHEAVFLDKGVVVFNREHNRRVLVNYVDPNNPYVSEQAMENTLHSWVVIDDSRLVVLLQNRQYGTGSLMQLWQVSGAVDVLDTLHFAQDISLGMDRDAKVAQLGDKQVLGLRMSYPQVNADRSHYEGRLRFIEISAADTLADLGEVRMSTVRSNFASCIGHAAHDGVAMQTAPPPYYKEMCYMDGMSMINFDGAVNTDGASYLVSHLDNTIQLNEFGALSRQTNLTIIE
ncbi:MAG: hypothetical protein OEZ43_03860 [Gammaproteobacteria bacterium]|nr:hypothetical protein [Gammaproteobacteria bacterium]